jgi:hypothetical protein
VTHGIGNTNPSPFFAVKQRIKAALSAHAGRFVVVPVPNVTHVFYGGDVGYVVKRIVLYKKLRRSLPRNCAASAPNAVVKAGGIKNRPTQRCCAPSIARFSRRR